MNYPLKLEYIIFYHNNKVINFPRNSEILIKIITNYKYGVCFSKSTGTLDPTSCEWNLEYQSLMFSINNLKRSSFVGLYRIGYILVWIIYKSISIGTHYLAKHLFVNDYLQRHIFQYGLFTKASILPCIIYKSIHFVMDNLLKYTLHGIKLMSFWVWTY